jgi:thiol-disulfide isomerase/thioredoxin
VTTAVARRRTPVVVALLALLLSACGTGTDAVAVGGTFTFVAPGGQTRIFYDPPETRGPVRGLSGESLLEPGRTVGVDDFPGQVVVLNLWGSWCGPCREEAPGLQQVYETTRASGVTVLGIDVRDDRAAATDFMRDRGLTYPSIFDNPGRSLVALRGFPRNTVPSTIVLDREHRVAAVFLTAMRVSELLPVVQRIAAEPPTAGAQIGVGP